MPIDFRTTSDLPNAGGLRDAGDVVSDLSAEIDEAFRISFDGNRFLLI